MGEQKRAKGTTTPSRHRSIDELPSNILAEILSRLPVKSIFASRCVSKSWLNLSTNDPLFAKLHSSRSHTNFLVRFPDKNHMNYVDLELDTDKGFGVLVDLKAKFKGFGVLVDVKDEFNLPNEGGYVVVNSCHGLLCLKDTVYDNPSIVFNPLTGEFIELPELRRVKRNCIESIISSGFGFCSRSNEFKVLRIQRISALNSEGSTAMLAELHVVGTNCYRGVGEEAPHCLPFGSCPFYLNGCIHWFCHLYREKFIVSFDFDSERFGRILPPFQLAYNNVKSREYMMTGVLDGRLFVSNCVQRGQFEIWVMKEYGVQESWSKDYAFELTSPRMLFRHCPFRPIRCLSSGEIVILFPNNSLLCFDPLEKRRRVLKIHGVGAEYEAVIYSPSFVRLKDVVVGDNVEVLNVRPSVAQGEQGRIGDPFLVEFYSVMAGNRKKLSKSFFRVLDFLVAQD